MELPAPISHTPRRGPWLQLGRCGRYEWNSVRLPIPGLPAALEGLRILHLSDLHLRGRWEPAFDQIIGRTRENPPEIIAMTGDFVDARFNPRPSIRHVQRLFEGLSAKMGIFAVLGNHDSDLLAAYLPSMGIQLLGGRQVQLDRMGSKIDLIGVPGHHRRDIDDRFFATQAPKTPGVPRILLSHYPDQIQRADALGADVYLAGHTHGGQICLPGARAIFRHDRLPRQYAHGVHRWNSTWLVVHRGLGFSLLPIRLFCPAEVIEITLTAAPAL